MNGKKLISTAAVLLLLSFTAIGQEQEAPSAEKFAADHLDFLIRNIEIDEIQAFFADSVYQHNFSGLIDEVEALKKSGISTNNVYESVSDKWMDKTDKALEQILTPAQWKKYLKTSFGKEKGRRDKRMAKRAAEGNGAK